MIQQGQAECRAIVTPAGLRTSNRHGHDVRPADHPGSRNKADLQPAGRVTELRRIREVYLGQNRLGS